MPLELQGISRRGHRVSSVCIRCHLSPEPIGIFCTLQQVVPRVGWPCTRSSYSASKATSCYFVISHLILLLEETVKNVFLHHLLHVTLILAFLVISSNYCLSLFFKDFSAHFLSLWSFSVEFLFWIFSHLMNTPTQQCRCCPFSL